MLWYYLINGSHIVIKGEISQNNLAVITLVTLVSHGNHLIPSLDIEQPMYCTNDIEPV